MGVFSDALTVLQYILEQLLTSEASRNRWNGGGGSSHWSSWWSALPGVGGGADGDGGAAGATALGNNELERSVVLFGLRIEELRANPAQARIKIRKELAPLVARTSPRPQPW